MANKETYREIANLFGVCESACCTFVHRLAEAFSKYILPKVVKWPTDNEKVEISYTIEEAKGFPHVIGMIDGCHIPIKKPYVNGDQYYNRKDFFSIVLQGW